MHFMSGNFANPETHHSGYFRVFRARGIVEVWFGNRWYLLNWRD